MGITTTPDMGLPLPNPAGSASPEPGPQYAADNNQAFTIIDSHNHSPGSGVQITPAGLDINTNLPFGSNSATGVYGILFSAPASSALTTFLYTNSQAGGGVTDLFYNDGAGNVIALTKAGAVNATIASLPGESYAGGTFTWKQGSGSTTPANFDIGSITIRPTVAATTFGVVLSPPSGISSQYNVALPLVPGAVTSIVQMDTSGNMLSSLVQDNATIVISSQTLEVGVIQTANIANGAVTAAKVAGGVLPGLGTATVFTSNGSFSVPSGVTYIYVIACGGGGGGGGGGRNSGTSDSTSGGTAGGGGGAGSTVWEGIIAVTSADTLAITIGGGGDGGSAGTAGSTGGTGSTGIATTIVNGSSATILSCPGGVGGTGGVGTSTNGVGGTGGSNAVRAGSTGTSGTTGASPAGGSNYLLSVGFGSGGTGGSVGVNGHGFGGGGGGSLGTGGAGGASASANTGGGGGGGNGGTDNNAAAAGSSGGSGHVTIYIV